MEHIALYRAWRPQSFQDMVGQQHIIQTLQNAIREQRTSHAYLFSGPRGTGKTSAAKILAKAVNCERGPAPASCRCKAGGLRNPPSPPPAAPVPPTYIVRSSSPLPRRRPEKPPHFAAPPSKCPAKLRSSAAPSGMSALNPGQLIANSRLPSRAPYRDTLPTAIDDRQEKDRIYKIVQDSREDFFLNLIL